jgi:hypothetical protein
MSVIRSVQMNQSVSRWSDFLEIQYGGVLRKPVEKIQIWLKSVKNIGEFT